MVVVMSGCALFRPSLKSIEPKSIYNVEKAIIQSPSEPNWYLMQNDRHILVLSKKLDDKTQSVVLSALMYPVSPARNSRTFLEFIAGQRLKQDDKTRFKVISVKNEYVTFKELPCLKYQTLSEDHRDKGIESSEFDYFKTSGYVCRYPLEGMAFQFEISYRSRTKEIPADLLKTGEEFFRNIRLVEAIVKKLKTVP